MLAYSSISQVGYIVLGLGCATPLAIFGAVFHLFNHATFKSLLFVNAASVERELGTTDMEKMGGLSQKMPVAGVSSVVGLLSTAGIPPLSGFWSKFIIILALWQAGRFGYAFIAVLASLLTLAYFLAMQRRVFFGKLRGGLENIRESSISLIISQSILVLITVGLGVFFPLVIKWR
jgi:multicomponent Na+:H+ antiporter subunit D